MRRIVLAVLVAAALLMAAALAGIGRPDPAHGATDTSAAGVTVNGHGAVTVVPDRATCSFGVVTRATTAAAALDANAARAIKLVAALKALGGKNVRTQQVSLVPQQRPNGTVSGYEAQNTVSAESTVAQAGGLIDAAVAAGANAVAGPSLEVADQTARYREALKLAVADARNKAEALAAAAGVGLGAITAMHEGGATTILAQDTAGIARGKTPIEPGTQDVTADVDITFAIR